MPTPRKVQMVAEICEQMSRAQVAIAADYRGLTVAQMTKLRRALRPAEAELHVMKNTLAAIAADKAGRPEFKQLLQGPTAIAFGFGDPIAPVKALLDTLRAERLQVPLLGGWLEGRILDAKAVEGLATLPSRDQLVANVVGKLQSPMYTFVGLLQASIRNFAGLVDARIRQLEEQGAAA